MLLPTVKRARVALTSLFLYPYNSVAGPYDNTTACQLLGLDSIDATIKIKDAVVKGGEVVGDIDSFQTESEQILKIAYAVSDLRLMQILMGGRLVVDAAVPGTSGEVQYYSTNVGDRAGYARVAAVSANGNGKETFLWPKTKISSSFGYKIERDKVTMWDIDLRVLIDPTYICQDGTVGGQFDVVFSQDGVTNFHT